MPPLGVDRMAIGWKQKLVKGTQHCKGWTGSYIFVNLAPRRQGSFRPIEMALLTEPTTNDQWNGCACQKLLPTGERYDGIGNTSKPQGAPLPISVFDLTSESEIWKRVSAVGVLKIIT